MVKAFGREGRIVGVSLRDRFVGLFLGVAVTIMIFFESAVVHCQVITPVALLDHEVGYLPTSHERKIADITSWITVALAVAEDTKVSWDAPDRTHAFTRQAARVGTTYAAALLIKRLVHRARPCVDLEESCGTDSPDSSFYSAHTALAFSTFG
jgi:hypothetical protein